MKSKYELIGGVISSRDSKKEQKLENMLKLGITCAQVYVEPGTKNKDVSIVSKYMEKVIIHAAHDANGFNLLNGADEINKRTIDEAILIAEYTSSKDIIIHAGYFPLRLKDISFHQGRLFDELFEQMIQYIRRNTGSDKRVLVENMPQWSNKNEYLFKRPYGAYFNDFCRAGFDFCLDLSNVAVTTNCFPRYAVDPPQGNVDYDLLDIFLINKNGKIILDSLSRLHFENLKIRHTQVLNEFIDIKPKVVHTRGVGYEDVERYERSSTGLNALQLALVCPYLIENSIPLIIETKPELFEQEVRFVREIIYHLKS